MTSKSSSDNDNFRPTIRQTVMISGLSSASLLPFDFQTRYQTVYGDSRVIRETVYDDFRPSSDSIWWYYSRHERDLWFQTHYQAVYDDFRHTIGQTVIILFLDSSLDSLCLFQTGHQASCNNFTHLKQFYNFRQFMTSDRLSDNRWWFVLRGFLFLLICFSFIA